MFSSSRRSPRHAGRIFVGVVLALLSVAIFSVLDARGAEAPVTPVAAAATLSAADSSHVVERRILDLASLGREAVRALTTMIAAVFEGWWQPVDAALDWIDGVRRGWTAVHRFPGTTAPRS
jgi:hypothetical protein